MTGAPLTSLGLTMESDRLAEFFLLLQQGVVVTARVGCTLDKLLSEQWGLSPDYVAQRITTIFLDGRAIDDVNRAVIREEAVIALSGAMPGLVGATMRRGGYYAAMREGITYQEAAADAPDRIATVRVKLFNLLLPELGPAFLRRGIIITASGLADFLRTKSASFLEGCSTAFLNGMPLGPEALQQGETISPGKAVLLSVTFKE